MDQETVQAPIANNWPGAFGVFKPSLHTVAFNLISFLLLIGGVILVQIVLSIISGIFNSPIAAILVQIIGYVISIVMSVAFTIILLRSSESKKADISSALSESLPLALRYLGLSILTSLITLASFVLFIIPFFFVFPRLILATYFLVDKKMGVMESISASWNQTKGHVGKVYGILGASIVMFLPAITIIGIPVAIFLSVAYCAATITLYKYITTGQVKDPQPTPLEAPVPTT